MSIIILVYFLIALSRNGGKMKRIVTLLLSIVLVFSLAVVFTACGQCTHVDEDGDGKCDKCANDYTPEAKDLTLIDEYGIVKFQFVMADGLPADVTRAIEDLVRNLTSADIEIKAVEDKAETISGCEVLIGDVKSRGEKYFYDKHILGEEGYVIKIVDTKVIINAGSAETLFATVKAFIKDVIGLDGDVEELYSVSIKESQEKEIIQSGYSITSLSVDGVSLAGYTIATDTENEKCLLSAQHLQDELYRSVGIFLEIVDIDEAGRSVIIKQIPKKSGDESFKVSVNSEKQLVIECAYLNKLFDGVDAFIDTLSEKSGEVNLTGSLFKLDISVVYYEDFGALGDGKTNDFLSIRAAHEFANES